MAQWLFENDACAFIHQIDGGQIGANLREQTGGRCQIKHALGVGLADGCQIFIGRRVGDIDACEAQSIEEALPKGIRCWRFSECFFDEGLGFFIDEGQVTVTAPVLAADADDSGICIELVMLMGAEQRRDEFAECEIASAAKDDDIYWAVRMGASGLGVRAHGQTSKLGLYGINIDA